jgi:2-methylcitrate dehydratase PrpD
VEDLMRGDTPVSVSVRTVDGQHLQAQRSVPPGAPEQPLSRAQLEKKFLSNATPVLGEARAAAALEMINRIADADSVRPLLDHVCIDASASPRP